MKMPVNCGIIKLNNFRISEKLIFCIENDKKDEDTRQIISGILKILNL